MAIAWNHPHADARCDGLVPVETQIPAQPSYVISDIGDIPMGAGPVVAPDGTVYVTSTDGTLRAFHSNGVLRWSASVGRPFSITTPAVVDAYGSVYVVAYWGALDHRTNPPTYVDETILCRFTPEGTLVWKAAFPKYSNVPGTRTGVYSAAAPNIWQNGNDEAIIVPATQYTIFGSMYTAVAFAPDDGTVLGQAHLSGPPPPVTGDSDFWGWLEDLLGGNFVHGVAAPPQMYSLPPNAKPLQPGVAIFNNPQGGLPFIIGTDGTEDIVGLTFEIATGFTERFRSHDDTWTLHTQPAVLSDGHSVVGTGDGRLRFAGPNGIPIADIHGLDAIFSRVCRTMNGTIVALGLQPYPNGSTVSFIRDGELLIQTKLNPRAISAPAASSTHIFFNLASGLYTMDAQTLTFVAETPWNGDNGGGGVSSPAIGPNGEVYAIANNQLYMWSGIRRPIIGVTEPGRVGAREE
jgi:hypothetical protein